jgi:hypothetical protein
LGICRNRLTKKNLVSLFLVVAFPIHAWAIYLVLRDFQWVYDQLGMGIFIGYAAYTLVFAFFESTIFLLFLWLFSFLFPKRWTGKKTFSLLSLWALVIPLWALGNQVFHLLMEDPPGFLSWIMPRVYHYQALGFSILVTLIFISVLLPLILIIRYVSVENWVIRFAERITLLSSMYLVFDFLGFIIILIRNLAS